MTSRDVVLALREARHRCGLSQRAAARRSGVGEKTISSFETGARLASMKFSQLERLVRAYGLTLAEFFAWKPDDELDDRRRDAAWRRAPVTAQRIRDLHERHQRGQHLTRAETTDLFQYLARVERTADSFDWQEYLRLNGWVQAMPGTRRS
jgi:transcriptional regulator with XRE-family HTH domain